MRPLAKLVGLAMAAYVRVVAATCRLDGAPPTQDQVVLASCVLTRDPGRARALATAALRSGDPIAPEWRAWAESLTGGRP